MPWTESDVESKKRGLTPDQKRKWVRIANGALKSCMDGGRDAAACEARAIRIANSQT